MEKAIIALKKFVEHRKELITTFRDKNQPWHSNVQSVKQHDSINL